MSYLAEEEHCPGRCFVEPQLQYRTFRGSSAEVNQSCGFGLSVERAESLQLSSARI
ncbi:hypothetical protein DN39_3332 [Vibrio cholerae]|nr:hypothetical protein DN39_3332 [Vibrio cholerae]